MKKTLIVSFSFQQVAKAFEVLEENGVEAIVWQQDGKPHTEAELIEYWNGLEVKPQGIIMGADAPVGEQFLNVAKGLNAISLNCAGSDHIDIEACKKHGVSVSNVPRKNFNAVADLAMGLILASMRNIVKGDKAIRAGKWCLGVERSVSLTGKTLGIIGMGAIGKAVAKRAKGFGLDLIALSTTKKPEISEEFGLSYKDGEDFFKSADIIVICCPHSENTHHLINKDSIGFMKDNAFIINPSRGGIIDTEALYEALVNKRIGGAALDVFETEPLRQHPLFELENVVLTPHMGGLGDVEIDEVAIKSAENLCLLLEGKDTNSKLN